MPIEVLEERPVGKNRRSPGQGPWGTRLDSLHMSCMNARDYSGSTRISTANLIKELQDLAEVDRWVSCVCGIEDVVVRLLLSTITPQCRQSTKMRACT